MSPKVFLLLSLFAVVAAVPAPAPAPAPVPEPSPTFPILFPVHGDIFHIGSNPIGKTIGSLFRTVVGKKHTARFLLGDILNIKIRSFDDCLQLGVKLCLGLGDVVDASINGLGNLVARIIFVIFRIVFCFGGYGNSVICPASYNTQFGVQATAAVNAKALIELFGLTNCKAMVLTHINTCTKGRGIGQVRGSLRAVFQVALDVSGILDLYINGGVLGKAEVTYCFRRVSIMLGVIGNSRQSGSGLQILNDFIPTCEKYLKSAGCPAIGDWRDVQTVIALGNGDCAPWAIIDVNAQTETGVTVSLGIGQLIGNIFRGVIGVTRLALHLVDDLVKIVLNSFEDCLSLGIKIVLGLGGCLDATISGFGSLLVRIVAGLLKICLCFLGTNKYGVCRPGWNAQFGVNVEVTTIAEVIQAFGIGNSRAEVDLFISTYTQSQGDATGSLKIFIDSTFTLSQIIETGKWDKSIVGIVFTHITYMVGAMGNSNSIGVGTDVCNKFIPACNKYLIAEGFTGYSSQPAIITVVAGANGDRHLWSADINVDINTRTGFIIGGGGGGPVGGTVGVSIGGLLGGIFRGIRGITQFATSVITDLINIKINAIVDVFNLTFKLVLGLGGAINTTIRGLGSLFIRIVAVIFKIGVCFKGFPGDSSICNNKNWNAQFGIYDEATSAAELIILFKLTNVERDFQSCVNDYTRGQGIDKATGASKIILYQCSSLITYIKDYTLITRETITKSFVVVTTVTAAIANANKKDSGKDIIQNLYPVCGKWFTSSGYQDITIYVTTTIVICGEANDDHDNWTPTGNTGTPPDTGYPVTKAPVTQAPATQPPVTKAPATQPPVTKAPATQPPVTKAPATQPPVTKAPATQPPVTKAPATQPPVTKAPATQPPVTKAPATQPPATEAPATEAPDTEAPDTEAPYTEAPATEAPDTEAPYTEAPYTEAPDTEAPVTQAPVTRAPVTQAPVTQAPGGGSGTTDIGVYIGGCLKVFRGVTKFAGSIVTEIINIKITTFNDIIRLIVKVSLGIGGVVDSLFIGLGSIFIRLVAVIVKVGVCCNGLPGDRGICTPKWNAQFGINGDASTAEDLYTLFRVTNCQNEVLKIKASLGNQVTSSVSVVIQSVLDLTVIVSAKVVTKQHFSTCFSKLFVIVGSVTNSDKRGSGTDLCQRVVPACSRICVSAGFPAITVEQTTINVSDNGQIDWKAGVSVNVGVQSTVTVKGDGLVTNVKDLFKNVKDKNVDQSSVTAVLNLDIPRSFDDVCSFGMKVMLALGNIIDMFIGQLGSLLIRIFGFLLRYIVCVLGVSRNSNCFVCQKAYFNSFGVTVTGNSWAELVAGFRLTNIRSDLDKISKTFKGGDRNALAGSERICFEQVEIMLVIFSKQTKITEDDMGSLFTCVTTLIGAFANSLSVDLGKKIVSNMAPVCGAYLVANKYPDFSVKLPSISSTIQGCNNDRAIWTQSITTTVEEN